MWTEHAVAAGVEAARSVVRGDGADLILIAADERRGEVALRLDVANLHCDDGTCLLPGRMLESLILSKLQEHLEGEFELRLEDPRETG
ncbi:MAG TPA: hypothetical protein VNE58_03735 [Casimicrobiaceae bacterium]|nr:hypothetical protein [Casimicrobiaceae bacterium]